MNDGVRSAAAAIPVAPLPSKVPLVARADFWGLVDRRL